MSLLIIGLTLWVVAHMLKRVAPGLRAAMTRAMGGASRGVMALMLVLSVVLMVLGYRAAGFTPVYQPLQGAGHLNNLLMLVALYAYGAGGPKGARVWLGTRLRHPQLTGFMIWAAAHLLVNGDLASVILFGTLFIWAGVSIALINGTEGPWMPPARRPLKSEIILIAITLVLFVLIAAIHIWFGKNPFLGAYT